LVKEDTAIEARHPSSSSRDGGGRQAWAKGKSYLFFLSFSGAAFAKRMVPRGSELQPCSTSENVPAAAPPNNKKKDHWGVGCYKQATPNGVWSRLNGGRKSAAEKQKE
jgi:hypothetical protein